MIGEKTYRWVAILNMRKKEWHHPLLFKIFGKIYKKAKIEKEKIRKDCYQEFFDGQT